MDRWRICCIILWVVVAEGVCACEEDAACCFHELSASANLVQLGPSRKSAPTIALNLLQLDTGNTRSTLQGLEEAWHSESQKLQEALESAQQAQAQSSRSASEATTIQAVVAKAKKTQASQATIDVQAAETLQGALLEVQQSEQVAQSELAQANKVAEEVQAALASAKGVEQADATLASQDDYAAEVMDIALQKMKESAGGHVEPALEETITATRDALRAQGAAAHTKAEASQNLLAVLQDAAKTTLAVASARQATSLPLLHDGVERLKLVQSSQSVSQQAAAEVLQSMQSLVHQDADTASGQYGAVDAPANTAASSLQHTVESVKAAQAEAQKMAVMAQEFEAAQKSTEQKLAASEEARDAMAMKMSMLREQVKSTEQHAQKAEVQEQAKEEQLSKILQDAVRLNEEKTFNPMQRGSLADPLFDAPWEDATSASREGLAPVAYHDGRGLFQAEHGRREEVSPAFARRSSYA
eukprot:gnl/TRDRNA2_/TRDRNA2_167259_c0_seq1.p1 gnl/TRDRNA2_/TRDRNA2_167259_c0~~gnl/TRDRNA2_/TRDRNA2_167259_c0_seq1.p1  ORF type:complete len:472 (-),score=148.54 gnl/TRDRNA2_/TRDRNA2_167259_c0_seq1:122-1537(-)